MATFRQVLKYNKLNKKIWISRKRALDKCPQRRGTCLKVFITSPRKPNSAKRKIAKIQLSNKKKIFGYIPGIKHQSLARYSTVLVRGGRVKDLPGMKFTIIRGKYDLIPVRTRRNARSKYAAKKIK